MNNFEKKIAFCISKEENDVITNIVRKDPEKYANLSHFVRAASIKLIREEKERLKI